MYCVNCGVKLADTEKVCPLCNTEVYHPVVRQNSATKLYPEGKMPPKAPHNKIISGAIVIIFLIPLITCFFSDIQLDGTLDWFGYVAGALAVAYTIFAMPLWFRKPNPVVFVPCGFAVSILYLLYINLTLDGDWFMTFAFPLVGAIGLLTTAVVALTRYIRRGHLYVYGGALIASGGIMMLLEYLLYETFDMQIYYWSLFPLILFSLLGLWLMFIALHKPTRETIKRKFFF